MGVFDLVIIIILGYGCYEGYRKGFFTSVIELTSSLFIFFAAYALKGPIGVILMEKMPFMNFGGVLAGLSSLNVLLYEGIAFIIAAVIVTILVKVLLKITGVFNKVLNTNFLTGIPNRILGILVNFLRYYVVCFIIAIIISLIPQGASLYDNSKLANNIVNNTPILSSVTKNLRKTTKEVSELINNITSDSSTQAINEKTIEILLDNNLINKETAEELRKKGKINYSDIDDILAHNPA